MTKTKTLTFRVGDRVMARVGYPVRRGVVVRLLCQGAGRFLSCFVEWDAPANPRRKLVAVTDIVHEPRFVGDSHRL